MKVLHCPIVALYQPYLFVKGLRQLGVEADYMVHDFHDCHAWLARGYDYSLDLEAFGQEYGCNAKISREMDFFHYAVSHYDVFHFHSGFGLLTPQQNMWARFDELKYLKSMGKKLVVSWWGCDLRTEDVDIHNKWSACNVCVSANRQNCKSIEKLQMIEKSRKYIGTHLSNGDICGSYPFTRWINNAIESDEFRPVSFNEIPHKYRLPATDNLRIYHSFGNSTLRGDVKGTGFIKAAVERLIREGYKVEFIFFDKVPNCDLKYYQAQADVVVDQLLAGWYGSTAVECMSVGKPVITYIRPEVEVIVPQKHPLINASQDTIYEVLKGLLDNPGELPRIGAASREYVLKYHDYRIVAEKLKEIYENIE